MVYDTDVRGGIKRDIFGRMRKDAVDCASLYYDLLVFYALSYLTDYRLAPLVWDDEENKGNIVKGHYCVLRQAKHLLPSGMGGSRDSRERQEEMCV